MFLSYEADQALSLLWQATWQSTVLATLVAIVILASRQWLPAKWRVVLWTLPLLRMLVVVVPASGLSIFNATSYLADSGVASPTTTPLENKSSSLPAINPDLQSIDENGPSALMFGLAPDSHIVPAATAVAAIETQASPQPANRWSVATTLFVLWLCGCAVMALRWAGATIALRRAIARCQPLDHDLWNELKPSDIAASRLQAWLPIRCLVTPPDLGPATCGLFRPTILLPQHLVSELKSEQLRAIIHHEYQHIRRFDVLLLALVRCITTFYWFNPVAFAIGRTLRREMELAVDAATISQLRVPDRQAYGQLLIELARRPASRFGLVQMADCKSDLRARIEQISCPSPSSRIRSAVAIAIVAALLVVGCTQQKQTDTSAATVPPTSTGTSLTALGITEPAATQDVAVKVDQNQGEFESAVRGSVLDTANNPIADALVTLLPNTPSDRFGSAKTNAQGDFDTLYVSSSQKGEQHMRGFVFKEGYAVAGLSTEYKPTVVVLKKATPIEVVVLSPEGKPVPDVSVCPGVISFRDVAFTAEVAGDLEERLSVKTDAMGRATIHSVSAPGLRNIKVNSTDWGNQQCAVPRVPLSDGAEASKPIEVRLKGVGVFEGHVVNSEGKPIPNTEIRLASTVISQTSNYAMASTDETGWVRLTMPVGRYRVSTRSLAGDEAIVPMVVQVKQGGTVKVDLPTQKFAKVRGRHITDRDEPVTDSPVFFQSEDGTANLVAYADASGYYEIKLPARKWQCSSFASETRAGFLPSKSVSVELKPTEMAVVEDVIVPTGEIIEGKLVGLDMSQTRVRVVTAKAKQGLCWGWYDDAGIFRLTAPRGVTAKDLSEFKVRAVEQPLRVSSTEPLEIQVMKSE